MDTDNTGTVTYDEFKSFWSTLVASQPVTLMHTLAEYNDILEEESTSGRLVMLEVGFTYCKPCRKFEPTYHAFAERFTDARFLRINGNENSEMVTLGRDILKVRTSPSFYLFRNKEIVYQVSGGSLLPDVPRLRCSLGLLCSATYDAVDLQGPTKSRSKMPFCATCSQAR